MNEADLRELIDDHPFGIAELTEDTGIFSLMKRNGCLEGYPAIKCKPLMYSIFLMGTML
jgi:hypothetical protein